MYPQEEMIGGSRLGIVQTSEFSHICRPLSVFLRCGDTALSGELRVDENFGKISPSRRDFSRV